jgi:hypothetical protein
MPLKGCHYLLALAQVISTGNTLSVLLRSYSFSSLIAQSHAALRPLAAHELGDFIPVDQHPTVTSWAIDGFWKPPRIYSMAPFTAIHGTNTRDRQQYDRSSLRRTSISRQLGDLSVANSYWKCHGVLPKPPMQPAGERSLYSAVTGTKKDHYAADLQY